MTPLTHEEYSVAQIILHYLNIDSGATIGQILELTNGIDINMDAIVTWIHENDFAMLAYKDWGQNCILNQSYCPITDRGRNYLRSTETK